MPVILATESVKTSQSRKLKNKQLQQEADNHTDHKGIIALQVAKVVRGTIGKRIVRLRIKDAHASLREGREIKGSEPLKKPSCLMHTDQDKL